MTLGAAFGLGQGVMFTFFPTYALDLGRAVGGALCGHLLGGRPRRAGRGRGGLADTVGRRAVIIPALAIQAAATVLLASLGLLARSLSLPAGPFLALAGLLAGAAHGLLYPALTALVVDVTPPERRGRVVGVFMAFILLGQAAGAAGFGHLAHGVGYGPMFAPPERRALPGRASSRSAWTADRGRVRTREPGGMYTRPARRRPRAPW